MNILAIFHLAILCLGVCLSRTPNVPENAPTNMSVVRRPGAEPVLPGRDSVQAAPRRVRPTPLSPHTSEAARRSAVRKGFGVRNARLRVSSDSGRPRQHRRKTTVSAPGRGDLRHSRRTGRKGFAVVAEIGAG